VTQRFNNQERELNIRSGQRIDYSLRNATIGSTLAARRAGINDANTAVKASSTVAKVSMIGSHGLTPNS
jgi:hypothetical protein